MKALILYGPGEAFKLEELPDPIAEPGEAVVKVITCGAGLTIQHVKAGRTPVDYPKIIGHEDDQLHVESPAHKNPVHQTPLSHRACPRPGPLLLSIEVLYLVNQVH